MIFARQCQANAHLADLLYRSGDYRPSTPSMIHAELNQKALVEYNRRLEEIDNA